MTLCCSTNRLRSFPMAPMLKLVVVGDGGVGKSVMLMTFYYNSYPTEYIPVVFSNYAPSLLVDGRRTDVAYWDTCGASRHADYERIRPLSYPNTDVFFLCFSVDNRESFENIPNRWLPELRHYCPETPIVIIGCKCDMRTTKPGYCVPLGEIRSRTTDWRLPYYETSALEQIGLSKPFEECVRIFRNRSQDPSRGCIPNEFLKKLKPRKKSKPVLTRPIMPPVGKTPEIEAKSSEFAADWMAALDNPSHDDVTFVLASGKRIRAHRLILSAASTFFAKVIGMDESRESQLKSVLNHNVFDRSALCHGCVPGIAMVNDDVSEDRRPRLIIHLQDIVEDQTFVYILQFLYSGLPKLPGVFDSEEMGKLQNLSVMWELGILEQMCINIQKDEACLNPSMATFHIDQTGARIKKWFLNSQREADVSFTVEGHIIHAHRTILVCRSEVMAAMLNGGFREGAQPSNSIEILDTTYGSFLALLEYLYTDHAPIEEGDPIGLLVLANQFCLPRLVSLAEIYITKGVEKAVEKGIAGADVDVIGLLNNAQDHNAHQLAEWCLHFISTNYSVFKSRPEISQLLGENLAYVEEHQWPPLSYLKELEEYETKVQETKDRCSLM